MFKEKIEELRKAVMVLTGYRVDLLPESHRYHLYPTYGRRGELLVFQCNAQASRPACRVWPLCHWRACLLERGPSACAGGDGAA